MRNAHKLAFVLVVLFCIFGYGQEEKAAPKDEAKAAAPAPPVYRIEFSVSEVESGKRLNTRSYTLMARDKEWARTDMSTRVPVATGSLQPGIGGVGINPLVNTQFQYMDVGLKFSLHPWESGDHVVLDGQFDMSSFAPADQEKIPTPVSQPVIRRVRTEFQAAVQPGKQTTVALLDDVTSKKQYQLEATVTKIK